MKQIEVYNYNLITTILIIDFFYSTSRRNKIYKIKYFIVKLQTSMQLSMFMYSKFIISLNLVT